MVNTYEYSVNGGPWQSITGYDSHNAVAITAALQHFKSFPRSVKPCDPTAFTATSHSGERVTIYVRESKP